MNKPRIKPITASAVATVTLEMRNLGNWGTDCTVEQVQRQAAEAAIGRLNQLFSKDEKRASDIQLVGEVTVKSVLTERT